MDLAAFFKSVLWYVTFTAWFIACHVLMLLVVGPLLLLGTLARLLIRVFLRLSGLGTRWRLMSNTDALFCLPSVDVPNNPPAVSTFSIFDGKIEIEALMARVDALSKAVGVNCSESERRENAAVFSEEMNDPRTKEMLFKMASYPVKKFGFYFWRLDDEFDVKRHFVPLRRFVV